MLLLSLFWAWLSWNAYHPWKGKPEMMGIISFIFGMLAGELGLHIIAINVVLTLGIVTFGELEGLADSLGLLIAMLSWLALARFYFQSANAEPVMRGAICEALDSETYPDTPDEVLHYTPDFERLRNPVAFKHPRLKLHRNVPYCKVDGRDLHLDIYQRRDCPKNAPVLLQIHGGAWMQNLGSKEQQGLPLMTQLAMNGWICVAVQYRLSPGATFPDHIIDCKRALLWVKDHIADYGGDPDFIVATGGSAGGHLSSLLALSANAECFQPGFEHRDTRVQACIPFYGVYDFLNSKHQRHNEGLEQWLAERVVKKTRSEDPELWERASPVSWVNEDAPPFLIIHGDADTLVPVKESRELYHMLKAVSKQGVGYAELPGAQHAFELVISLRSQLVVNALCDYCYVLHQQYLGENVSLTSDNSNTSSSDSDNRNNDNEEGEPSPA